MQQPIWIFDSLAIDYSIRSHSAIIVDGQNFLQIRGEMDCGNPTTLSFTLPDYYGRYFSYSRDYDQPGLNKKSVRISFDHQREEIVNAVIRSPRQIEIIRGGLDRAMRKYSILRVKLTQVLDGRSHLPAIFDLAKFDEQWVACRKLIPK